MSRVAQISRLGKGVQKVAEKLRGNSRSFQISRHLMSLFCSWASKWKGSDISAQILEAFFFTFRHSFWEIRLPLPISCSISGLYGVQFQKLVSELKISASTKKEKLGNSNRILQDSCPKTEGDRNDEWLRSRIIVHDCSKGQESTCERNMNREEIDFNLPFSLIEPSLTIRGATCI